MTNQIVPAKQNGNILAVTEADKKIAATLKMMLPYGSKLTDDNALALALYSRVHGLDPLNGECYFLVRDKKDRDGNITGREELGCYPGIKARRKKAKEQLAEAGRAATYKVEYDIVPPDKWANLGIDAQNTAICVKATLRDDISMGQYLLQLTKLSQAGYTKDEISQILGKPPIVTGYGTVKTSEIKWAKVEPIKTARKRAEADAITQRFDLGLGDASAEDIAPDMLLDSGQDADETVEAHFTVTTVEEELNHAVEQNERHTNAEILTQLGFDA